jgi:non-specific serine/threonine protein kinase/serine/threonine-protein kinase
MALRKEHARRYQSVGQFAEDIRRYLENVPVVARNDTAWYRTSKFVRRHKVGVVGSAVAALALICGLAVALYEAHAAREQAQIAGMQRARAEMRFNDVRKLANSLMFEIHDSIRDLPGATPARQLLVSRALQYLDSLSQEAGGDVSLQRELAAAYDRVGDVLGYNGAANLGDFAGALQNYKKALAIRESAAAANPDDPQTRSELLSDYFRLSFALQDAGDYPAALEDLRKGLPLAQAFVAASNDPKYQEWLAGFYWQSGSVLRQAGDYAQALENFQRSAAIREPIATGPKANPIARMHLSGDYLGLGQMQFRTGDRTHGLENVKKALQILESLVAADPTNATLREYLGEGYEYIAPLLEKKGDVDQALDYNHKARAIYAKLVSADPTNALARDNFGFAEMGIAHELMLHNKVQQAFPHLRKAISLFEAIEPKNRYAIAGQAESYSAMGSAYEALSERELSSSDKVRDLREAESWYQKSLNTWEKEQDHGAVDPLGGDDSKDQVIKRLARLRDRVVRN